MRKETEGDTEFLIESAKNEFLKYGFNNAEQAGSISMKLYLISFHMKI